jgi:hypothetical protein
MAGEDLRCDKTRSRLDPRVQSSIIWGRADEEARRGREENLAAAALELSPADLEKVGGFVSSHKVSGPRYNPADLAAIDR